MLKQFLSTSAVSVMGLGLMLIVNVLFARMLEVDAFGLYSLAITAALFLSIPVCGGLPLLLTREVAAARLDGHRDRQKMVGTAAMLWVLASSFFVIAIAFPLARSIGTPSAMMVGLAMIALPALGVAAVGKGILKGLGMPALAEAPSRLGIPAVLITGAVFLWQSGTASAMTAVSLHVGALVFVALLSVVLVARVSPTGTRAMRPLPADLGNWGKSLASFALISGMSTLGVQLTILVLGALGQPDQVAYLRVAERGAQLVNFPLLFINSILGPHIVRALRDGKADHMRQLTRKAARMTTAIAAPVALIFILFGKPLIGLTFGPAYVEQSYPPLVILSLAQLLSVMAGSAGMILMMTGHERLNLMVQAAGVIVMVSALALLVGPFQVIGGAIAMALGLVALNLFAVTAVYRKLGFIPSVF